MEYRLPKKGFAAVLLSGMLLAAGLTFFILAALSGAGQTGRLLSGWYYAASLLFLPTAALLLRRYFLFDYLYRLEEEYASPGITFFRVFRGKRGGQERSVRLGQVLFDGSEEFFPLDRKGKKKLKGLRREGSMTANLFPVKKYALIFTIDGERRYLILEAEDFFVPLLEAKLAHAKKIFGDL